MHTRIRMVQIHRPHQRLLLFLLLLTLIAFAQVDAHVITASSWLRSSPSSPSSSSSSSPSPAWSNAASSTASTTLSTPSVTTPPSALSSASFISTRAPSHSSESDPTQAPRLPPIAPAVDAQSLKLPLSDLSPYANGTVSEVVDEKNPQFILTTEIPLNVESTLAGPIAPDHHTFVELDFATIQAAQRDEYQDTINFFYFSRDPESLRQAGQVEQFIKSAVVTTFDDGVLLFSKCDCNNKYNAAPCKQAKITGADKKLFLSCKLKKDGSVQPFEGEVTSEALTAWFVATLMHQDESSVQALTSTEAFDAANDGSKIMFITVAGASDKDFRRFATKYKDAHRFWSVDCDVGVSTAGAHTLLSFCTKYSLSSHPPSLRAIYQKLNLAYTEKVFSFPLLEGFYYKVSRKIARSNADMYHQHIAADESAKTEHNTRHSLDKERAEMEEWRRRKADPGGHVWEGIQIRPDKALGTGGPVGGVTKYAASPENYDATFVAPEAGSFGPAHNGVLLADARGTLDLVEAEENFRLRDFNRRGLKKKVMEEFRRDEL